MRKQLLTFLLALVISASLFAAGGSQRAPQAGGITEITHIFWDRGTIPPDQGNVDDNWWTRYVDQKIAPLGAKMKYVSIPRAQEAQLLSTMLAANNAPDISKTNEVPLLQTYITGGGVADITGLLDSNGPNIKKLLGPGVLADIKYDGKYYWIPHLQNDFARGTWIRKDWCDAAGVQVPTNPQELREAVRVIRDKDPGKVGRALIPFGMQGSPTSPIAIYESVILPGFVKNAWTPEKLLAPTPMWPETKDALRYLNGLYNDGLLTDTFIADRDESLFKQSIARGEIIAFGGYGHYLYHSAYGELYNKVREHTPDAVYSFINAFPSPNGQLADFRPTNPMYGYRWFIPASSRNVELTLKVIDFLSSEAGYLVGTLGIEGEDYTLVNRVPTPINRERYLARVPWIEAQYGNAAKPFATGGNNELYILNYIKDFNPDYHAQILREAKLLSDSGVFPPTISAPTPQKDKLTPMVTEYWNNALARIVFAPAANFDRLFDEALREYRSMGGDQILEEANRLYAAQQGR